MMKKLTYKFLNILIVVPILYYIYFLVTDSNIKWNLVNGITLWGLALLGIFVVAAIFDNLNKKMK